MTYDLYLPSTEAVRRHLTDLRDQDKLPPGTLHILVGDFHSFAKLAIFIDDVPAEPPAAECARVVGNSLSALSEVTTVHSALLAASRTGGDGVSEADLRWRDAFEAATAQAHAENHGVYVVSEELVGRLGGGTSR